MLSFVVCHPQGLRALVTDVLKLEGDASVIQLNPQKGPLHYFDLRPNHNYHHHLGDVLKFYTIGIQVPSQVR